MARLRLLKVIVQPVFVLDDGEHLVEQVADPVAVPAAEWPTYPNQGFSQAFEMLRAQLEDGEGSTIPEPVDLSAD